MQQFFTEQDLELLKASLKRAWLEDFNNFCRKLGGNTQKVMGHLLASEADFRVLLVTVNALNTNLGSAQQLQNRNALFPNFGYLYPEGKTKLGKAWCVLNRDKGVGVCVFRCVFARI